MGTCEHCGRPIHPYKYFPDTWYHVTFGWIACENEKANKYVAKTGALEATPAKIKTILKVYDEV